MRGRFGGDDGELATTRAGTAADEPRDRGVDSLPFRRLLHRLLKSAAFQRAQRVFAIYNRAGGSLLAEGLAYSALFAGLTALLLCVGLLGYLVPAPADRQRIIDAFTGQLAPFASIARGGLSTVAANAGAFSLVGLAGLAWGSSHFYGALDLAISRIFNRTPARGSLDRLLRGFVSLLLLIGGLVSAIVILAIQATIANSVNVGGERDLTRTIETYTLPLFTAAVVVVAVGIVYRVVPNTRGAGGGPPSAGPRGRHGPDDSGGASRLYRSAPDWRLSVFGGVATVFAALAWLHLAFQVLLIGAAWTRVRLEDRLGRREV